jgi:hypothetical protein
MLGEVFGGERKREQERARGRALLETAPLLLETAPLLLKTAP